MLHHGWLAYLNYIWTSWYEKDLYHQQSDALSSIELLYANHWYKLRTEVFLGQNLVVHHNHLALGHLLLKVCTVSIAAFKILLVISPHFIWIPSKNFSFFNVSHKSLSFKTWNLIEYLHTQDFQWAMVHLNIWLNIVLFSFVHGFKQHKNILTESKRRKLVFTLCSPLYFKSFLLT